MDVTVKARSCEVAPRLKDEVAERVTRAARFFDRLQAVDIMFTMESNPRIPDPAGVEITARSKGHHIRAEGSAGEHRAAVDVALARFERQLSRYKLRLLDRQRGRVRQPVPASAAAANAAGDGFVAAAPEPGGQHLWPQPRIVRTKRFDLRPMLPDDAAVQLELLGHDFFLFTNAFSGECNVVYRRRDGDLGLIEGVPAPATEGLPV